MGRGPFERYADNKTSTKTEVYHSKIDNKYGPCIFPNTMGTILIPCE